MNIDRKKKYVVVVVSNNDVFTNPTLDLFFKKLIKEDTGIILIASAQYYLPAYSDQIIFLTESSFDFRSASTSRRDRLQLLKRRFKLILKLLFVPKLAVIGVDPIGFVTAARLNYFLRSKLGYFSFELIFKDEIAAYGTNKKDIDFVELKRQEEKYFKKPIFLMIQDEYRCKLICSENGRIPKDIFLIPVAGISNSKQGAVPDKEKFKKELGIPLDKKIIVFSGSLQEWTGLQILLESFEEKWDKRFWFLIHTRFELKKGNMFYEKIKALNAKGLPISLHNMPFENMDELSDFLSHCDFGMVSYLQMNHPYVGKNIMQIGLASGKFSLYMMLGLPVLVTKCATYDELLKKYNFGIVMEKMQDIQDKLPLLLNDHKERSEACKILYHECLDPENKMNSFVGFLQASK